MRRARASLKMIENTIEAGQKRGLTATSVSHYPDGRSVVHFGDSADAPQIKATSSWSDI